MLGVTLSLLMCTKTYHVVTARDRHYLCQRKFISAQDVAFFVGIAYISLIQLLGFKTLSFDGLLLKKS